MGIQAQAQGMISQPTLQISTSKKKFTLSKLQFRLFDNYLKEWLPFWSQFEQPTTKYIVYNHSRKIYYG